MEQRKGKPPVKGPGKKLWKKKTSTWKSCFYLHSLAQFVSPVNTQRRPQPFTFPTSPPWTSSSMIPSPATGLLLAFSQLSLQLSDNTMSPACIPNLCLVQLQLQASWGVAGSFTLFVCPTSCPIYSSSSSSQNPKNVPPLIKTCFLILQTNNAQ